MSTLSEVQSLAGRTARERQYRGEVPPELASALAAAKIAHFAEKALADAPPLTDSQKARIAAVLDGAA